MPTSPGTSTSARTILRFLLLLALLVANGCGLAHVDGELFPDPPADAITFWGHACVYIDIGGFGIATDPVFAKTTFFRRRKIPAPPPSAYRQTKVILISHAHPDHLSRPTLETFPRDAVILCPEPSAKHLDGLGQTVHPMRIGDEYEIPGGRIVAVPAKHPGGRMSLRAKVDGRALGYVIQTGRATVLYSGDTNEFEGFENVGWTYRPDVSLLNINGHLHSIDAVWAAWATRASVVIPLHYGAYGYYLFGHYDQPRDHEEMERLLAPMYRLVDIGASFPIAPDSLRPRVFP